MSALAYSNESIDSNSNVTSISASARLDYVLRFSKHVAIVVDDSSEVRSQVCNHFLANLPDQHNAAYLQISPKLNDIQVRCRIIEQLFPNAMFDPEQSVAVSIINLSKADRNSISILIENTHYLSLQIVYELSQLALVAKKYEFIVNVVMSGEYGAARIVADNEELFKKNVSILSAKTGQLISPKSLAYQNSQSLLNLTPSKKMVVAFAGLIALTATIVTALYSVDSLSFSQLDEPSEPPVVLSTEAFVQPSISEVIDERNVQMSSNDIPVANANDVFLALENSDEISPNVVENKREQFEEMQPELSLNEETTTVQVNESNEIKNQERSDIKIAEVKLDAPLLTFEGYLPEYYLQFDEGYVVQLVVFSKQEQLSEFVKYYGTDGIYGYTRELNGNNSLVLTSVVFGEREEAKNYLLDLPTEMKSLGSFIKPINIVRNEINTFESSQ